MKNIFRFKVFGIVFGFVLIALVLCLYSSGGGGVVKPPKWAAFIQPSSANLIALPADDHVYVSGEDGVTISTGINRCGTGKTMTNYSYINLQVMLPSQVLFSIASFEDWWSDPSLVSCGFPAGGSTWPECLGAFLSQPQPYEGYQSAVLRFSTSGCEDRVSADFMQMPIGTWLKANLLIYLDSQHNSGLDCPEGCDEYNYHRLRARARGHIFPGEMYPDIYIFRDGENEWTVHVDTHFQNPDYQYPEDFPYMSLCDHFYEQYCVCVEKIGKRGKIVYEQEYKDPAWAKAHLNFQIKFFKLS